MFEQYPTEELKEVRDLLFSVLPLLKDEAKAEQIIIHQLLCEEIEKRERVGK
jgi:hypothetical protein